MTETVECGLEGGGIAGVYCGCTTVIAQNAFTSSGGEIVAKRSARVVEQTIEDIEIL